MNRNTMAFTMISLSFAGGIALAQASSNTITPAAGSDASRVQGEESNPFTHLAQIPPDSGTIRFEKAKMVQVPTRITYTMNPKYCEDLSFRDPGGSMYCTNMYCTNVQTGSPTTAYRVTYSYVGQPLASDEYAGRKFSFDVYFRPDELAPQVREALTEKKLDRADLAGYFKVSVLHAPARRIVIDEARSHFCDGNYVDGTWTRSDANCKDEIYTTVIAGPPDYVRVRVDPVSAGAGLVSANTVGTTPSSAK